MVLLYFVEGLLILLILMGVIYFFKRDIIIRNFLLIFLLVEIYLISLFYIDI